MALIVELKEHGGVDKLEITERAIPAPGPEEIALRQTAIGINFLDIYHRIGDVHALPLPAVLGVEGIGTVTAIGRSVTRLKLGDRIAYAGAIGAYASERLLPAWRAIPLPASIPDPIGATALIRGITAQMLLTRVHPVGRGSVVLVHAAAGGLGTLLSTWAKQKGAIVIGTVGSEAKAKLAREAGADHVIIGRDADFAAEVSALTDGRGVDVAYDGIGGSTLLKTFACVRPFGTVASIGQSGGSIPLLSVEELGPKRSIALARPSVMRYMSDPATYRQAAAEVLDMLAEGVMPLLGRAYSLREAAAAQADLEAGRTTGCAYLVP